jgi:hypothetical protein
VKRDGHKENQEENRAQVWKKSFREGRNAMRERKRGTLRPGRAVKKLTSRKQAIAIGLGSGSSGAM